MLHHADVVIDPEELIYDDDSTMLLSLCTTNSNVNVDKLESLRLLLKFGANVNATDKFGNTAIHLFLKCLYNKDKDSYVIEKDFAMLLLQSIIKTGADLHVRNNFGIEASQVAYGHLCCDENEYNCLPLRTQFWNEVLTEIGLDVSEFRSCCSGCRCQDADLFESKLFCNSFQKGAYLDLITLGPAVAGNFFVGSNCSQKKNADIPRPVFEIFDSTEEAHNDSEAKLEDHPWPSNHNNSISGSTSNQEPNNLATVDTRRKTFWNVI